MQRAMGVTDSFDAASTNQAPSCRFLTLLTNSNHSMFWSPSPPNGRALPTCTITFLPRARWVVDRDQTDYKRVASIRGDPSPAR